MTFDQWLKTGPLADEPLTERERTLLNIAFLQGKAVSYSDNVAALDRVIQAIKTANPQGAT